MTEVWQTEGLVRRIRALRRERLRDLYPSEAWSLYRTLPQCGSVVDLGCGSGAMSEIVRVISPQTRYTGVEMNSALVESARSEYGSDTTRFIEADLHHFLATRQATADCVMSWAVLYLLPEFEHLIDDMIASASRFVLFDMRVAKVDATVADCRMAYTMYGDTRVPIVIASFADLLRRLHLHDRQLRSVEISGYDMPFSSLSWVSDDLPQTSVISVVLERSPGDERRATDEVAEWYVNVPARLWGDGSAAG